MDDAASASLAAGTIFDEDEGFLSERKLVEDYLKVHDLQEILNGVVNEIVSERPQDPYVALSGSLTDFSKTNKKILDVRSNELLGPQGMYLNVEIETNKGTFSSSFGGSGYDGNTEKHAGKGYAKVINTIDALIKPKLRGQDITAQANIDNLLINEAGLPDVAKQAISVACCKAGATENKQELCQYIAALANNYVTCVPTPIITILEAGNNANTKLWFEGIVLIPHGATSFEEAIEACTQVQRKIEGTLKEKGKLGYGKHGGCTAALDTLEAALDLVKEAISAEGLSAKVAYGLDMNARSFGELVRRGGEEDCVYNLSTWDPEANPPVMKKWTDLRDLYTELLVKYPFICLIEPLHPVHKNYLGRISENCRQLIQGSGADNDAFKLHINGVGGDSDCAMQVVADGAAVTERDLDEASTKKTFNTALISFQKAVTVTNLIKLVQKAQSLGVAVIFNVDQESYNDSYENFTPHAAVALRAGQFKAGPARNFEQFSKYNELLRLERMGIPYAGSKFRNFR